MSVSEHLSRSAAYCETSRELVTGQALEIATMRDTIAGYLHRIRQMRDEVAGNDFLEGVQSAIDAADAAADDAHGLVLEADIRLHSSRLNVLKTRGYRVHATESRIGMTLAQTLIALGELVEQVPDFVSGLDDAANEAQRLNGS